MVGLRRHRFVPCCRCPYCTVPRRSTATVAPCYPLPAAGRLGILGHQLQSTRAAAEPLQSHVPVGGPQGGPEGTGADTGLTNIRVQTNDEQTVLLTGPLCVRPHMWAVEWAGLARGSSKTSRQDGKGFDAP